MPAQNNLAIFYCGTNGAGKTTLRGFNKDPVPIVIDSDHIAMELSPDNPRLADSQAGRKAVALFQFAIEQGISFSMESFGWQFGFAADTQSKNERFLCAFKLCRRE